MVVDAVSGSPSFAGFHHAYDGGFTDSSAAGNHGTASGAATITSDPAAIAAGTGALSLDGADSSYVMLANPGFFGESSPWTAAWWARRGELGAQMGMVMGTAATTTDFIWLNDSYTGLRFRSSANNSFDFTVPKDQQLRHYALVADGAGHLTLYLDGHFSQTLTGATPFAIDSIGKAYPESSYHYNFNGTLDEVHVIGSALNANQIEALYEDEKPPLPITRLRIVLMAGQSNADGRAVVSELPTSPPTEAPISPASGKAVATPPPPATARNTLRLNKPSPRAWPLSPRRIRSPPAISSRWSGCRASRTPLRAFRRPIRPT